MKILILTICILCSAALASAAESMHVLSFSASWCPPCQQMKASWSESAVQNKLESFQFHGIDIDQKPDYTNSWQVDIVPTTIIAKVAEGKTTVLKRRVGYMGLKNLLNFLNLPK